MERPIKSAIHSDQKRSTKWVMIHNIVYQSVIITQTKLEGIKSTKHDNCHYV